MAQSNTDSELEMTDTLNQLAIKKDGISAIAVVPTFNEEAHIEACLRSLITAELADVPFLVVDGMSTDRTRDVVRQLMTEFPNLHLADNPHRLQSAALNLASRHPLARDMTTMVRCDAHSIYPAGFVTRVIQSLKDTGAASVVTVMDATGQTCFERANAWVVDTPLGSGGSAHRGGTQSGYVDHGHHAGFNLDWFRRIDGYDPTFSHNEDAEYDTRLLAAGGDIYLDADLRIAYVPRGSLSSLARQYFNYGKGRARTTLKHKKIPKLRQMLPVGAFLGNFLGLIFAPVNPIGVIVIGTYAVLMGLTSAYFVASKRSVCGIWAGPAMGAMHLSWGAGFLTQMLRSLFHNVRRSDARTLDPRREPVAPRKTQKNVSNS